MSELSTEQQAALDAYWNAKTREEEKEAYARMRNLGFPASYGEADSRITAIALAEAHGLGCSGLRGPSGTGAGPSGPLIQVGPPDFPDSMLAIALDTNRDLARAVASLMLLMEQQHGRERLLEELVRDCQNDLAAYLPPDSGISKREVISKLLSRLDGPQARKAMGAGRE